MRACVRACVRVSVGGWVCGSVGVGVCACACMCVCVLAYVCVWWGGQKLLYPPVPQAGVTQSPTYQRSMRNVVPGGRNSVLN